MSDRSFSTSTTRRRFIGNMAAIGAGITFLPRSLRGQDANGKLRLASVGVGGMGGSDLGNLSSHPNLEIVALSDVDAVTLKGAGERYKGAQMFEDWRDMFEKMGDKFDAVHCATPDHMHAPVTMTAINHGKHVYCQKPLTHEAYEARKVAQAAKQKGIVSQMGIQIHSHSSYRTAINWIHQGVIGKVKEVHSWSNKKWGYDGPAPQPSPVPDRLNWNLWLGVAPERPFSEGHYHPANWRKWLDFGCGTMGDMSIHILDPVWGALELTRPLTVVSHSPAPPKDSFGTKNRVVYQFPGTKHTTETVKVVWYDGDSAPPPSTEWPMPKGLRAPGQGSMFVGTDGHMLLPHVGPPMLLPRDTFKGNEPESLGSNNHWHQFVDACLGKGETSAPFSYAGPLTEMVLLGVLANRFPGQEMKIDGEALKITNFADGDALIRRTYRKGWEVEGLSGDRA